jgi:cytochrome c oxidase subunit 2
MILPIPVNEDESKKLAAYLVSPTGAAPAAKPAAGTAAAATAPAGGGDWQAIVQSHNCWVCHTMPDVANAKGTIGPNLAGLMKRPKMAGGVLDTNPANIRKWLTNPQVVKPGTAMVVVPQLTPAEVEIMAKHITETYK